MTAGLIGPGWGGTDQYHLAVAAVAQSPGQRDGDGAVTGHDGMIRRRGRRPASELLAQRKAHGFHGGHRRRSRRQEAGDPERHRNRSRARGRRGIQHEQLNIEKNDIRPTLGVLRHDLLGQILAQADITEDERCDPHPDDEQQAPQRPSREHARGGHPVA